MLREGKKKKTRAPTGEKPPTKRGNYLESSVWTPFSLFNVFFFFNLFNFFTFSGGPSLLFFIILRAVNQRYPDVILGIPV